MNIQAGVISARPELLEEARVKKLISVQTLIIKIKNHSDVVTRIDYLGEFKSFFKTSNGQWGYFSLNMIPDATNANLILKDLEKESDILHAYFAPFAQNANQVEGLKSEIPKAEERNLLLTPSFEKNQSYLYDAPLGVGVKAAWDLPGGRGKNVKIIDVETCFEEHHEDFMPAFFVGNNPNCESPDHGTSVWGILAAKEDNKGVTGIAHEAQFGIYGIVEGSWTDANDQYIASLNTAIQGAMDHLESGDVLVIEQQMIGPDFKRRVAVEFWPHIFEQLQAATEKGIICVEAAGNGNSNLDSIYYDKAFDTSQRDSGCIMVGAMKSDSSFTRWSYSNFGKRIDVAGPGENVVSTGYGDLFNAGYDRRYTKSFSGTSSATPVVAGVVALMSSLAKEQNLELSSKRIRRALRLTGIPQGEDASTNRIGNFPSVSELLEKLNLLRSE